MARKAVGSGVVNTPQAGASRRDSMNLATITRKVYHKEMWPTDAEIAKGTADSPYQHRKEIHRIDLDASLNTILVQFAGSMMSVLYGDFLAPGKGTPQRLMNLAEVAYAISKELEGSDKRVFLSIQKTLLAAQKTVTSYVLLDAHPTHISLRLVDLVDSMTVNYKLDLRGMIPTPAGTHLPPKK